MRGQVKDYIGYCSRLCADGSVTGVNKDQDGRPLLQTLADPIGTDPWIQIPCTVGWQSHY